DFLIARAESERSEMQTLLDTSRRDGDYWREKATAKLATFLGLEVQFLSRLAELESDYPELAAAIEERKRYLAALVSEARAMYAAWQGAAEQT
ncbi:MAG: hypothetical protein U1A28_03990, partial [Patescibacteria group bacterium]|nr:hypothetical protein [Patescibacteria group bacterium]